MACLKRASNKQPMSEQIIGLGDWLQTAPGQYMLGWEQAQFDLTVADLFGFNALQLGLVELDALRANRMPHRWLALPEEATGPDPLADAALDPLARQRVHLVTNAAALPFPAASLDLLVLPHTLELSADPHHVLREVERVLVDGEGNEVALSSGEYHLLHALLRHPRQVMSRDRLLDLVRGREAEIFDRAIDNLVSRLRKKIEVDAANPQIVKTVWGGGYTLACEVKRMGPAT